MTRINRWLVPLACSFFIAASAIVFAQSSATSGPPRPPVIATVNIERIMNSLDETKDRETSLKAQSEEMAATIEQMENKVEALRTRLENAVDADKPALAEQLRKLAFQLKLENDYSIARYEELRAKAFKEIFEKVQNASRTLADNNGYTMVIADDQHIAVRAGGTSDILQQISLRDILYAKDTHDVTDQLMTLMNNEYARSK